MKNFHLIFYFLTVIFMTGHSKAQTDGQTIVNDIVNEYMQHKLKDHSEEDRNRILKEYEDLKHGYQEVYQLMYWNELSDEEKSIHTKVGKLRKISLRSRRKNKGLEPSVSSSEEPDFTQKIEFELNIIKAKRQKEINSLIAAYEDENVDENEVFLKSRLLNKNSYLAELYDSLYKSASNRERDFLDNMEVQIDKVKVFDKEKLKLYPNVMLSEIMKHVSKERSDFPAFVRQYNATNKLQLQLQQSQQSQQSQPVEVRGEIQ